MSLDINEAALRAALRQEAVKQADLEERVETVIAGAQFIELLHRA